MPSSSKSETTRRQFLAGGTSEALAGMTLGTPRTSLPGGKFRDKVRVYDHRVPANMLDKASCREWAAKCKADPAGFTCHRCGLQHTTPDKDPGRDLANRVLIRARPEIAMMLVALSSLSFLFSA